MGFISITLNSYGIWCIELIFIVYNMYFIQVVNKDSRIVDLYVSVIVDMLLVHKVKSLVFPF